MEHQMHLEKAFLTTTRYSSKKKKSNSKRVAESDAKHNAWLAKQGLTPNQIQLKKAFVGNVRINDTNYDLVRNTTKLSNNLRVTGGFKKDVITNMHKESPQVQKEIMLKASRCMPLFNKGGLQYATPGEDMTQVGSKSRRG